VILIASQLGRVASPGRAAYCATKGALVQLAKVLAADHAAQGIRANTISPGAIETRRMLRRWKDMDEARAMMGPKHLLGRLGRPEEIARAASPRQRCLRLHDGQRPAHRRRLHGGVTMAATSPPRTSRGARDGSLAQPCAHPGGSRGVPGQARAYERAMGGPLTGDENRATALARTSR
jgi:hypothetical protein